MSKTRVLHIIPNLGKAGAERMAVEICLELSKRDDFEVLLVAFSPFNAFKNYTDCFPYKVCTSYLNLSISRRTSKDLTDFVNIVNEFKPDIIHSHLFRADLISREIIFPDIKYFSHQHGVDSVFFKPSFSRFFSKANLVKLYERSKMLKAYRACDNTFIAVSQYIESFLKQHIPVDLRKIKMLYNAVNTKDFIPVSGHEKSYSDKGRDELRLISVGTLLPRKNQKLQLDIVAELTRRGHKVSLKILGEGREKQALTEHSYSLGLTEMVTFLGNVDNVAEYMGESDIMLHTAVDEPFGLVLVEAMAAGLPCVALDGTGNREILKDNFNSFVLKDQNVQTFADKIMLLASSDEMWKKFSVNAVETAKEYDIVQYIDRLCDIYQESLGQEVIV